jgi:hypothetical protein
MKKHGFLAVVAMFGVSLTALATPAAACRTSDLQRPFLFQSAPAAATAPFIAEVEVTEVVRAPRAQVSHMSVRVLRVMEGQRHLRHIRINAPRLTSCSITPRVGDRGFLAGAVGSMNGDTAVMTRHVEAPSQFERERASQGHSRHSVPLTKTGR